MKSIVRLFFILMTVMTHAKDPHSFAQPQHAVVTHLSWKAKVDLNTHTIHAQATWDLFIHQSVGYVVLDTRDLQIVQVTVDGQLSSWETGKNDPVLGAYLRIPIGPSAKKISIEYNTAPDAAALLWVEKPSVFLFTQSQAILARTWIPCQDSPGVRFTYDAQVEVPAGFLALMSAENPQQKSTDGVYRFNQPLPISSYLLALAVGDLKFKPISDRAGVYATADMIEASVFEFADLENMISSAEALYGEYRWKRYDLLILPGAFPFGGMENPMLTFVTPTVVCGDRSLVSLIAHELAHSWSGNLVTNATWDDFWLNEGFTVYFEFRIMEALYGKEVAEMLASLAIQDLYETMESLDADDTKLKLNLTGRDPDDGMNDVAYNKGYWFLRSIEEYIGRERMDHNIKRYFDQYAFKKMTTEQFVEILKSEWLDPGAYKAINPESWIYQPLVPSQAYPIVSSKIQAVDQYIQDTNEGKQELAALPWMSWTYQERYRFLSKVSWSEQRMNQMDQLFQVSKEKNSEIQFIWLMSSIRCDNRSQADFCTSFLGSVGRRKFILPLYRTMVQQGGWWAELAHSNFEQFQNQYHNVTKNSVEMLWQK